MYNRTYFQRKRVADDLLAIVGEKRELYRVASTAREIADADVVAILAIAHMEQKKGDAWELFRREIVEKEHTANVKRHFETVRKFEYLKAVKEEQKARAEVLAKKRAIDEFFSDAFWNA